MDEHVLSAVVGLNEAIALLTVVPLYDTHIHGEVLSLVNALSCAGKRAQQSSKFGEK
jgi:hypothetical protein